MRLADLQTALARWLLLVAILPGGRGLAADDPAAPADDELSRKAQEVQRLKDALDRAQSDLKRLEEENRRLRQEKPAATNAPAAGPAVAPMAGLPPLQEGDLVTARDLATHFQADPTVAAERYSKKVLRLSGTVTGFSIGVLQRTYEVRLESPDKSVRLTCRFNYVDQYRSVVTQQKGRVLVGRIDDRSVRTLLHLGEAVVIQGRCGSLKDGEIALTGCQVIRAQETGP
jgi:hypothetical protein